MIALEKNHKDGYAEYMTLSTRNNVFKLGIAFSFLCLFLCVIASINVIPVYPSIENEITRTTESFFRTFSDRFPDTNLLATHYGILALVFFAFLSIVLSYFSFEKTHSPEILFVDLFTASFSF
jgi:hypothetical protein